MKLYKEFLKKNLHFFIVSIIVFILLTSYNNENGFHFNDKTVLFKSVIPQGWAFFTRNARENQISVYRIENNNLISLNESSSLNPNLIFGFKRTNRRISLAMGTVINKPIKWKHFLNHKSLLVDQQYNFFKVKNDDDSQFEKGKYVLISEERIPWAWAKNFKNPEKRYYKFIVE